MKRDEILNIPAGKELDALVAEKVMGHIWPDDRCPVCGWLYSDSRETGCAPDDCSMRPIPNPRADANPPYSTDIAAAWEVVEKLAEMKHEPAITIFDDKWICVINSAGYAREINLPFEDGDYSDTAPLAICRAALLAVTTEERT